MEKLREVKIKLNLGVIKLEGVITPSIIDRKAAWELYIELITRVTVVELKESKGILREALNSIYTLFETTREVLKRYGPKLAKYDLQNAKNLNLGIVSVSMLNYVLRPFLTQWHPLLEDYESTKKEGISRKIHEEQWDNKKELEKALAEVRETLGHYAQLLADIAGVNPIQNISILR